MYSFFVEFSGYWDEWKPIRSLVARKMRMVPGYGYPLCLKVSDPAILYIQGILKKRMSPAGYAA